MIYHSLQKTLAKKGVVFLSMDGDSNNVRLLKNIFGKVVPYGDNKLAALNTAVWSGEFCVYPKESWWTCHYKLFRINSENAGQFERTLIVAEEELACRTWRAVQPRFPLPVYIQPWWK